MNLAVTRTAANNVYALLAFFFEFKGNTNAAYTSVVCKPSDKVGLMTEKIYIHMIDGTDIWVAVDAIRQADNQFLLQTFDDFDPRDTSVIPQFIRLYSSSKSQLKVVLAIEVGVPYIL